MTTYILNFRACKIEFII